MTAPPERIAALDELRESLRQAAQRELASAAPRRRHRRRRRLGGLLAVAVLAGAGAAGAAQLISTGEPVKDMRDISGYRPGPGMPQLSVVAPDSGGGPGWGARVYTARNHQRCVLAGVVNGVELGRISGGRFHPYAPDFAGSCDRPGHPFGSLQHTGGRTLVFGIARPGAKAVTITVDGRPRTAPAGRGGAFLAVYRGELEGSDLKIDYGG